MPLTLVNFAIVAFISAVSERQPVKTINFSNNAKGSTVITIQKRY